MIKKIKIAVAAIGTAVIIFAILFSFAELNLFKFPVFLKSGHVQSQASLPGNSKIAGLANPQQFAALNNPNLSSDSDETFKDRRFNKDNRAKSSDMDSSEYIEPKTSAKALSEKSKLRSGTACLSSRVTSQTLVASNQCHPSLGYSDEFSDRT